MLLAVNHHLVYAEGNYQPSSYTCSSADLECNRAVQIGARLTIRYLVQNRGNMFDFCPDSGQQVT